MYSVIYDKTDLEMRVTVGDGDEQIIIDHHACVNIDWAALSIGKVVVATAPGINITIKPDAVYFTTVCECGCRRNRIRSLSAAEFAVVAAGISRAVAMRASVTVWN